MYFLSIERKRRGRFEKGWQNLFLLAWMEKLKYIGIRICVHVKFRMERSYLCLFHIKVINKKINKIDHNLQSFHCIHYKLNILHCPCELIINRSTLKVSNWNDNNQREVNTFPISENYVTKIGKSHFCVCMYIYWIIFLYFLRLFFCRLCCFVVSIYVWSNTHKTCCVRFGVLTIRQLWTGVRPTAPLVDGWLICWLY